MEFAIGQAEKIEGLLLMEAIISGGYVQGDPVTLEEFRAKLKDILRIQDPAAVLINSLNVADILKDDLSAIATDVIALDRLMGPRLCAIAVKPNSLINIDGTLVHQFRMPGVLMCGSDRDFIWYYLRELLADKAAEPQGMRPVYFPLMTLDANQAMHHFRADWFSNHLWRMQEPSLADLSRDPKYHGYRFLWLRTFHEPICIRVEIDQSGTATLISKRTSGKGGYFPGRLVVNDSKALSRREGQAFIDRLEKANFWRAQVISDRGLDGAEWILEGAKGGLYHVAHQWSPKEGAFRETALLLLKFSAMKVKEIY